MSSLPPVVHLLLVLQRLPRPQRRQKLHLKHSHPNLVIRRRSERMRLLVRLGRTPQTTRRRNVLSQVQMAMQPRCLIPRPRSRSPHHRQPHTNPLVLQSARSAVLTSMLLRRPTTLTLTNLLWRHLAGPLRPKTMHSPRRVATQRLHQMLWRAAPLPLSAPHLRQRPSRPQSPAPGNLPRRRYRVVQRSLTRGRDEQLQRPDRGRLCRAG